MAASTMEEKSAPGFFERLGRYVAPLPEDLPPPTPPSKTLMGRVAQMVAPDADARVRRRPRARSRYCLFPLISPSSIRACKADTVAAGVEETKSTSAPMDVEAAAAAAEAPAPKAIGRVTAAPVVPAAKGPPLKIGIRITGANWEEYNAKHNVEQLIAEITGEMVRAQADSPVRSYGAQTFCDFCVRA